MVWYRNNYLYYLLTLIIIWGINPPLIRVAEDRGANLLGLILVRFALGSLFLLLFAEFRDLNKLNVSEFIKILIISIPNDLFVIFFFIALQYSPPPLVVTITYTSPFFTIIFSKIILKTNVKYNEILGAIFATIGVGLIEEFNAFQGYFKGYTFSLLAACLWGLGTVLYKRFTVTLDENSFAFVQTTLGLLMTIPFFFVLPFPILRYSVLNMLLYLFIGMGTQGLAYILWFKLIKAGSPVMVSISITAVPIIATILSYFILNTILNIMSLIGILLIVSGIAVARYYA